MKKLKTPELKVPSVLRDLYQDLRDRHLLPLVGLLVIAIVAVPFLLSDDSHEPVQAGSVAPRPLTTAPASMAVVRAAPGLRSPSKRLAHRDPTNPFKQHHVSAPLSDESVTIESTETPDEAEPSETSVPSGTPTATTVRSGIVFYATAATIKIVRSETTLDGEVIHEEPIVRERVLPSTTLLGEKAQIVTYMGPSPKTRQPTFLISDQVSAVFGEGKCLAGAERCQLIELQENEPEVFVYGTNEIRYRLVVLDTELVETGRAERP